LHYSSKKPHLIEEKLELPTKNAEELSNGEGGLLPLKGTEKVPIRMRKGNYIL
jgi:hypothetical protein